MNATKAILTYVLMLFSTTITGQQHEIYKPEIKSLQVVCGDKWLALPIMKLSSNTPEENTINISFDDLTHTYHRYTYSIIHCESDWSPSSELFPSDYIEGFATDNTIEDIDQSVNTNVLYTHYRIKIPNERCRLKISGNYELTVYDDDSGEKVLTARFMVLAPQMSVNLYATTNTDIDTNGSHQQISMRLNYNSTKVTDPKSEIKTIVMQNRRWDNAKINIPAQYITTTGLEWTHNKGLIFDAGNEYHKFETLSTSHSTMGIDNISWDGENYHAAVFHDVPRPNYLYDEDANGAFYIRNSDNIENETTCDYMLVDFTLECPKQIQGEVYLNGAWTYDRLLPEYEMVYNSEKKQYTGSVMLKQGYYSYQYILRKPNGETGVMPTEGSYFQTENKYQALVYYKKQGDRYDKLIGYQEIQIK